MKHPKVISLAVLMLLGTCVSSNLYANNGKICYAYPIKDIRIDGQLDDWPTDVQYFEIADYQNGEPDNDRDSKTYFRVGYSTQTQSLYVATEMLDDDYVRTPDNSFYRTHDFQVLYLDPLHQTSSGVVAYELCEDNRKIVHQEDMVWYPQVQAASWDDVEVAMGHKDGKTIYEWRIQLKEEIAPGRSFGFDYAVFDKDTDQDQVMVTWGRGAVKHDNEHLIGDIILLPTKAELGKLSGSLKWSGEEMARYPRVVHIQSPQNANFKLSAEVDSNGHYVAQLPPGEYSVEVSARLIGLDRQTMYRPKGKEEAKVKVLAGKETKATPISVVAQSGPDLIGKKGILQGEAFTAAKQKEIDAFIESYRSFYDIPGVSLAVIMDGKVVYDQVYGVQNNMGEEPVHELSLFEAASITKPVFAYAISRLVQRGEFDLDQPLYERLTFPELEKTPDYKLMTGRHVLTHTTGLPNWGARLLNKPGTKYGYSGEGFEYLKKAWAGAFDERMIKKINKLLEEEVTGQFGMKNTFFMDHPTLRERGVSGHRNGVPTVQNWPDGPGMAWSMQTSAKDFSQFAIALLNREGLEPEMEKEMFSIQTPLPKENRRPGSDEFAEGVGIGLFLRESPQGLVFGQSG
ncbi:MAG: serine hydrolase, partial [Bacteroidota bacterium]